MATIKGKTIKYYKSFKQDFITTSNQNYKLNKNYKWENNHLYYKIISFLVYSLLWSLGFIFIKILHIKIEDHAHLSHYRKQNYVLYSNHTQPQGDVFIPPYFIKGKRPLYLVDPSNLGIHVIGKLLPFGGAIPIPKRLSQIKAFKKALNKKFTFQKALIIFPEEHLWPYMTKIRPFNPAAFHFPIKNHCLSFCATTTYHKVKDQKKPKIIIHIDGPFYAKKNLNYRQQKRQLERQIKYCMQKRSQESNYQYIVYKKGDDSVK